MAAVLAPSCATAAVAPVFDPRNLLAPVDLCEIESVRVADQPIGGALRLAPARWLAGPLGGGQAVNRGEAQAGVELLRQIEASLQAGGAVVTVTEGQSSEGQSQN